MTIADWYSTAECNDMWHVTCELYSHVIFMFTYRLSLWTPLEGSVNLYIWGLYLLFMSKPKESKSSWAICHQSFLHVTTKKHIVCLFTSWFTCSFYCTENILLNRYWLIFHFFSSIIGKIWCFCVRLTITLWVLNFKLMMPNKKKCMLHHAKCWWICL